MDKFLEFDQGTEGKIFTIKTLLWTLSKYCKLFISCWPFVVFLLIISQDDYLQMKCPQKLSNGEEATLLGLRLADVNVISYCINNTVLRHSYHLIYIFINLFIPIFMLIQLYIYIFLLHWIFFVDHSTSFAFIIFVSAALEFAASTSSSHSYSSSPSCSTPSGSFCF